MKCTYAFGSTETMRQMEIQQSPSCAKNQEYCLSEGVWRVKVKAYKTNVLYHEKIMTTACYFH